MAVKNFFDNLNSGAKWDVGVSINRSNALPLDANSVFETLDAAQNYAKGNPTGGRFANAYPGQVLAVVTDEETVIYYIDANMQLQPVGNTKEVMAYVGDIPEGSDAKTIIEYIDAKTEGIATDAALSELQKDVDDLDVAINGKDAVGEEGTEGYQPAVIGLAEEVAGIKETIGVEASDGVEATGIEKKIADEVKARKAADDAINAILDGQPSVGNEGDDGYQASTMGLIEKADVAFEHSQEDHIEHITVNGVEVVLDENNTVDIVVPEYQIKKAEDSGEYAAVYQLMKGEQSVGVPINIPKDLVVQSGSVVTLTDGQVEGKAAGTYIELVLANKESEKLYIPVDSLIEYVTSGSSDTDVVVINIDQNHKVTATITDGTVELAKLHPDVQTSLSLADSAIQVVSGENAIDVNAVDNDDKNLKVTLKINETESKGNVELTQDANGLKANIDLSGYELTDTIYTFADGTEDGTFVVTEEGKDPQIVKVKAEMNAIASVDENQFEIDNNRKLTLIDIAQGKISGLKNTNGEDVTLEEALAGKVDIADGCRLITSDEATKLEKLVLGENGEVSVSGKVAAGNVDGLDDWIIARAGSLDGLSENNFSDALLNKLNGIKAGAQVNVIESIKFNGTLVEIAEGKVAEITYTLPIADNDTLGGVKSVDAILGDDGKITNATAIENKIAVAGDGTMSVNSLNVNKLVQTEGESLILNGGSASV